MSHRAAETGESIDQETAALEALCGLVAAHGVNARRPALAAKGADRRFAAYAARIDDDLASPLDLECLASVGGVTRFQVIRDFNQAIGMSPGAYLRARRLDAARRMILAGAPMADAAAAAGFADQAHFSRVFRAAHGITPRAFRAAMR